MHQPASLRLANFAVKIPALRIELTPSTPTWYLLQATLTDAQGVVFLPPWTLGSEHLLRRRRSSGSRMRSIRSSMVSARGIFDYVDLDCLAKAAASVLSACTSFHRSFAQSIRALKRPSCSSLRAGVSRVSHLMIGHLTANCSKKSGMPQALLWRPWRKGLLAPMAIRGRAGGHYFLLPSTGMRCLCRPNRWRCSESDGFSAPQP